MSGRLLSFSKYLGGADNVQVLEVFKDSASTFTYNYGTNITNYNFELSAQTLVVNSLTYDRTTGDPNFTDSTITGFFANTEIASSNINRLSNVDGTVNITIPGNLYTGNVLPDSRGETPITVVGVRWTNTGVTPAVVDEHRWALIHRYSPDSTLGKPSTSAGFTALTTT
tara:strand:+ start:894 stop:1400 length:507 start_codon:yes stop_codon:yes gene_type:complete